MKRVTITCASLLAVACASPQEATAGDPQANPQEEAFHGDGTAEIETEQEAVQVALWFLRGRGAFTDKTALETTVIETDTGWSVMVVDPDDRAIGSDVFVDLSRDGWRVSARAGY